MKHIGMTLAAVVVGGVLLTAGDSKACEGHHARADAPPTAESGAKQAASAEAAPAKQDKTGALHAAKCQCGSAADCTCKKGTCECAKCKRRQDEAVPQQEAARPEAPAAITA